MADLAVIGIEARSDSVVKAAKDLDQLSAASDRAEVSVQGTTNAAKMLDAAAERAALAVSEQEAAAKRLAQTEQRLAAETQRTSAATTAAEAAAHNAEAALLRTEAAATRAAAAEEKLAAAQNAAASASKMAAAAQNAAAGHLTTASGVMGKLAANSNLAQHQMQNLSYQLTDVAMMLASGQNPFMTMMQQGPQIVQAFGPGTGVTAIFRGLISTIGMMVAPFLPVIAVVGVLGLALRTVKDDAQSMTTATVTWGHMIHGAFAEAGARIHATFGPALDLIGNGMTVAGNIIIRIIDLNINSVRALAHVINTVLGAAYASLEPIVRPAIDAMVSGFATVRAKVGEAAKWIESSFSAAFDKVASIWAMLPSVIKSAAIGAVNVVVANINIMVEKAAAGINYLISLANQVPGLNLSPVNEKALNIPTLPDTALDDAEKKAGTVARMIGSAFGRAGDEIKKAGAAVKSEVDAVNAIMSESPVGSFLQGAAKRAAGFAEADAKKKKGGGGSKAEQRDPYAEILKSQRQYIDGLNLEAQTVGMAEEAAMRLRIEQDLLNKAANDNIKLTPLQTAELRALAAETAAAEMNVKSLKESMDFAKDLTGGFFSDMKSGLMQGKGLWKSFADAATNALNKILDKMLDMAVNSLFSGGSFWSGLFSIFGGSPGGAFSPTMMVGARAAGGPVMQGQPYMVGERGPELMVPTTAGRVVPTHKLQAGGGSNTVLNYAPVINAQGADAAKIDQLRAELQAQKRDFSRMVDARLYQRDARAVRA